MRLLVIDTALGACTAAVFEDERPLAVRFEPMAKGHQERLGGLVRDVMAEAGGGFDALDRIGVTVGPGSFTGLRVGLAFAQGLGAALDRPVVGVSALDGLAASVDSAGPPVAALIDARRGQGLSSPLLAHVPRRFPRSREGRTHCQLLPPRRRRSASSRPHYASHSRSSAACSAAEAARRLPPPPPLPPPAPAPPGGPATVAPSPPAPLP